MINRKQGIIMKIGNVNLKDGLFLAPMAGFSDRAMRIMCRRFGAEYLTTEMVSAKAICYKDKKTPLLARITEEQNPCAVQIFGSDPTFMAHAAEEIACGAVGGIAPVAIDINMGCPVPKIVNNNEGSALMKDPARVEKIVYAVKNAVSLPVTVKIRSGWDNGSINALEIALAAEAGGADAVFVHARTRAQMYSGSADFSVIRRVKECVKIPVIGNGDVVDSKSALRLKEESGCDGIMIGRGAIGRPFVFREIHCALNGLDYTEPEICKKISIAKEQLRLAVEDKGEFSAVTEARKQLAEYIKGINGAARLRGRINSATTYEEVSKILEEACTV